MATVYNFDLLDLADGECGDAAVSVVFAKKKTEAAAAKVADGADPTQPAAQEKPKFSYCTKVQLDAALRICKQEREKFKEPIRKLRSEGKKLKEQPGNEARLEEVRNELQKLSLEGIKLLMKELVTLVPQRDAFYKENGIPLPELNPDDALRICVQDKKIYQDALSTLKDEVTNLKGQPGSEARLKENLAEQRKLNLERSRLRVKERMTLVPERDSFYKENGIPLPPKPNPHDALDICLQDQKVYKAALHKLNVEETNLKGEEISAEKQKLWQESKKLLEEERRLRNEIYAELLSICLQEQEENNDALLKLEVEKTNLKGQPGNEARLKEISDQQQKLRTEQKKLREKEMRLVHKRYADLLSICQQEQKNNDALFKLEVEETNLKGQPGNEARQQKLRTEQEKLREEYRRLVHQRDAELGSNHNGGYINNNGGSCVYSDCGGYDDEYQTQQGDGCDHYPHDHDERQVERGHSYYNNGDRQAYRQRQPKMTKKYMPKVKASSVAGTEAEEKPEENVVSATDTEQKEASADNADAVPASGSDKSAGGAAQEDSKKKGPKNTLSGSEKRKKKNAKKNSGTEAKQDSEVDGSTDKQPLEEEKKTLAEYEKMREEKKKTMEASKTEVRKVTAEEFKDLKVLEKKKLDDEEAVIKVEKAQPKVKYASRKEVQAEGKDAAAKDGKTKKVVPLHEIFSFKQSRRFTVQEDGFSARPRFNGGFQGGSRDNSTEPRINGRAAQNEAGGHNSNGAPRGAYNGRGDGAPRGDYSGGRGNGGYGYGRGNGGNQGNGGYQQQRQGGNAGQYQQERAGNGGYQQQRQGGNVGQYQQERAGNGGYYQQRNYRGSDRYYQQRGNYGDRRNFQRGPAQPAINVEDMKAFPALTAPASAQSAAPTSAPAPVPAQASPAAAPAHAA